MHVLQAWRNREAGGAQHYKTDLQGKKTTVLERKGSAVNSAVGNAKGGERAACNGKSQGTHSRQHDAVM